MAKFCSKCGSEIKSESKFCIVCGTPVASSSAPEVNEEEASKPVDAPEVTPAKVDDVVETVQVAEAKTTEVTPVLVATSGSDNQATHDASYTQPKPISAKKPAEKFDPNSLPEEYRPINMWAYFGLELLLSIPVVGFILTFVLAFAPQNKNVKNFVRSRFCFWIVWGVSIAIVIAFFMPIVVNIIDNIASMF